MTDFLKQYSIEGGDYEVKGDTIMFPIQTVAEEDVNLLIIQSGKKSFDEELESGQFTMVGEDLQDTIYFVKTIDDALVINRATGASAVAYYKAENCKAVVDSFYDFGCPNNSTVVIDGDESAEGIKAIESCKPTSSLISIKKHTEFNNYAQMMLEKGYPFVCNELQSSSEQEKKRGPKIEFKRVTDLGELKGVDWLVEDVIQRDGFINIFGPSGHCKSFVALDMACCVADGRSWHGHPTDKTGVLYICGEGEDGINARIKAWQLENDHDGELDVFMTDDPVRLLNEGYYDMLVDAIKDLVEATGIEIGMVIFDTMNRCFGDGDENSTRDMTLFTDACIDLRRETGMSVVVVHHTSVANPRQARGNGSLKASLETEINVLKPANESGELHGYVEMKITKQKNGTEISPIFFMPEIVELGTDSKGRNVSSLIMRSGSQVDRFVESCNEKEEAGSKGKKPAKNQKAIAKLVEKERAKAIEIEGFSGIEQYAHKTIEWVKTKGGSVKRDKLILMMKADAGIRECAREVMEYLINNKKAEFTNENCLTLIGQ